MITITRLIKALAELDCEGDNSTEYLQSAKRDLEEAAEALNTISVRGRDNVDTLLGIMLGIEVIIGKDEKAN